MCKIYYSYFYEVPNFLINDTHIVIVTGLITTKNAE